METITVYQRVRKAICEANGNQDLFLGNIYRPRMLNKYMEDIVRDNDPVEIEQRAWTVNQDTGAHLAPCINECALNLKQYLTSLFECNKKTDCIKPLVECINIMAMLGQNIGILMSHPYSNSEQQSKLYKGVDQFLYQTFHTIYPGLVTVFPILIHHYESFKDDPTIAINLVESVYRFTEEDIFNLASQTHCSPLDSKKVLFFGNTDKTSDKLSSYDEPSISFTENECQNGTVENHYFSTAFVINTPHPPKLIPLNEIIQEQDKHEWTIDSTSENLETKEPNTIFTELNRNLETKEPNTIFTELNQIDLKTKQPIQKLETIEVNKHITTQLNSPIDELGPEKRPREASTNNDGDDEDADVILLEGPPKKTKKETEIF
jgi:hypothetical protein